MLNSIKLIFTDLNNKNIVFNKIYHIFHLKKHVDENINIIKSFYSSVDKNFHNEIKFELRDPFNIYNSVYFTEELRKFENDNKIKVTFINSGNELIEFTIHRSIDYKGDKL